MSLQGVKTQLGEVRDAYLDPLFDKPDSLTEILQKIKDKEIGIEWWEEETRKLNALKNLIPEKRQEQIGSILSQAKGMFDTAWEGAETVENWWDLPDVIAAGGAHGINIFNQGVGLLSQGVAGVLHHGARIHKPAADLGGGAVSAYVTPFAISKVYKGARTVVGTSKSILEGGITAHAGTGLIKSGGTKGLLSSAVEDTLLLAEKSRRANLIKTGVLKDKPRGLILKSKEEAIKFYKLDSKQASELGFAYYQKGSKFKPKWELGSKALKNRQKILREARIKEVTSPEVMQRGLEKIKAINKKGLDPHHIIPTHVSKKIKDSMTPAQWKQRVIDDAKRHIYHGNHPRNLVAARDANRIPKTTAGKKSQLWHRLGEPDVENLGYHALEAKIKAMNTIDDYYLYRDMMAKQMKTRRQGERFLDQLILDYNN